MAVPLSSMLMLPPLLAIGSEPWKLPATVGVNDTLMTADSHAAMLVVEIPVLENGGFGLAGPALVIVRVVVPVFVTVTVCGGTAAPTTPLKFNARLSGSTKRRAT